MKLFSLVIFALLFSCSAHEEASNTLKIAIDSVPRTADSRFAIDASSQYFENLIHCSLIGFDQIGKVENQLAKDLKWEDPTTLLITLKDNILFSDNSSVTSNDVKATFDFLMQKEGESISPRGSSFENVESITVVDPYSLKIKLKNIDASFVTNLAIGILPVKLASEKKTLSETQIIGCGPFKIKSWTSQSIFLERNDSHLFPIAKGVVGEIEFKIVSDETTRMLKIQKGEVDLIQNILNRDQLKDILKTDKLELLKSPGLNVTYLGFNMQDKILKDLKVRQAISHAIKREEITEHILNGYASLAQAFLPPNDQYFFKSVSYIYDIELAKKLLDEAGYKDPDGDGPLSRFSLSYKTTTNTTRQVIANSFSHQLKKIGIDVKVVSMEWGKFKKDVEEGNVQLWSLNWVGFKDPDIFRYAFSTSSFIPVGGNRGKYSNPALDTLLEKGRQQIDPAQRKVIYNEVQKILSEDLPYLMLWHEDNFVVKKRNIQNYEIYADGRMQSLINVKIK